MKKNICILGTSPLMILIFYRLCKNYSIDVYDENKLIGGAWSYNQFDKARFSNFTNIILPANPTEDDIIPQINNELKMYSCEIYPPRVPLKIKDPYKPKNIFIHNFSEFYKKFINENLVLKKKIETIEINENRVMIDNHEYKFLFLPSCFSLKNLIINKYRYPLNIKTIKSTHFNVCFSDYNMPLCTYDDDFDNIFDRAQIRKIDNEYIFTGRVRKNYKLEDANYFIDNSSFLSKLKNSIINHKINYYNHSIIDENDLLEIKKLSIKLPFSIVETRQFNYGYIYLDESIKKLNIITDRF